MLTKADRTVADALAVLDDIRLAGLRHIGCKDVGVSPDDAASHARFRQKYGLQFPLLADTDHSVAEEYGVWGEKSLYGKTYMGVERSTFVIDADGTVVKVLRKVKPDTHADDVLAALSA